MDHCSFCKAVTNTYEGKWPDGWGRAKLEILGQETVDVTFCPLHRAEAEEKLGLAFHFLIRSEG